jgi:hypothetical protein
MTKDKGRKNDENLMTKKEWRFTIDSGLRTVGVEQQQKFGIQNSALLVLPSAFRVLTRFVIRASYFIIFYSILHPSSLILFPNYPATWL